jgi:alpha-L-rhamnosidase
MRLNGNRVGDEYFMPGWTDYNKRIYYRTYDVTPLLESGSNTLGAILGDGWFRGNISIKGQNQYGKLIRLKAQLQIDYVDRASEVIASDPSWKAAFGPILESDMQAGETYDARKEMPGWDRSGFDDRSWAAVDVGSDLSANPLIQAYPGVPVRKAQELPALTLNGPKPEKVVFDLGQNFSGWIRLKVKGVAGEKIVMRFGEMLNADGTVYTENLRSARVTDTYICKGGGEEVWEPHFTFHGFRYVEITGLSAKPNLETVTGIVVHSDAPMTSSFECSNPMLNQLHSNVVWGQRSNYLDVPTDCPQRDERLGWTGDTQIYIRSGSYHQDVSAFFTKWNIDLMDTQNRAGTFGNQAPVFHGYGSPGWADAGVICPWTIYHVYGDVRMIAQHYEQMARFIEYCKSKGLKGPGNVGYGDWLAIGSKTPKDLISSVYFAHCTRLMVEIADALERGDDAAAYRQLLAAIKANFQKSFVQADGTITGNSQTAYSMAICFDLLTDEQREQAAAHLVKRVEEKDYHLSVGFLGVNLLLPALTEIGRSDLAYRLIQNTSYPSWGYSIEQGATTIWERWNSYTKKDGFGPVKMNSFNHYAYGSCSEWMFRSMLGIDTDGVGFQKIKMKPEFDQSVPWAKGHYDSIHGRIRSDWKWDGATFQWAITVPPNTTATAYMPENAASLTESGTPIQKANGVKFLRTEKRRNVYKLQSGSYAFKVVSN